jgi:hypothetical protein
MSPHVCTKINKKHVLFWIAAMLIVAFGLPNTSRSGEPNWPETLTIGTASPGGTYYRYGEGLARLLTRKLGLPVIARPTEPIYRVNRLGLAPRAAQAASIHHSCLRPSI